MEFLWLWIYGFNWSSRAVMLRGLSLTRWFAPTVLRDRDEGNAMPKTLGVGIAVRIETGGPEGSCTLNPPADNGALC